MDIIKDMLVKNGNIIVIIQVRSLILDHILMGNFILENKQQRTRQEMKQLRFWTNPQKKNILPLQFCFIYPKPLVCTQIGTIDFCVFFVASFVASQFGHKLSFVDHTLATKPQMYHKTNHKLFYTMCTQKFVVSFVATLWPQNN